MKHLTREERRRIQRRSANIRFLIFILVILAVGFAIGYTSAYAATRVQEPPDAPAAKVEVTVAPGPEALLEAMERPAEDYSSLDPLELIGTFTATAYCPCVECCGVWSADHPDHGDDYVQRTSSGTIPEEGRTIAADPDVLPIGSEVIIAGHPYVVEDTGGAIKGHRIDIYFESHEAALEFGVQEVDLYRERK